MIKQRSDILHLYKGILLSGLSSVFFSLCAVTVKTLHNIYPGQLAIHRFMSILLVSLPIVIYKKESLFGKPNEHLLLMLRSFAGSTNLFLNFLAYRYLPLGEASVIIFSVPVFVPIMAKVFLKEPCGMVQAAPAVLTVVGLAIITDSPTKYNANARSLDSKRMIGLISALASVFLGSTIFVILRKLKQVDSTVVLFNFAWFGALETSLLTYIFGEFTFLTCGYQPILIVVFGVFSFLGQYFMTCATRQEEASVVATVRSATDIIASFIWQFVIFKNVPDASSIFGAVLVSFSIFLVGIQKWQQVSK